MARLTSVMSWWSVREAPRLVLSNLTAVDMRDILIWRRVSGQPRDSWNIVQHHLTYCSLGRHNNGPDQDINWIFAPDISDLPAVIKISNWVTSLAHSLTTSWSQTPAGHRGGEIETLWIRTEQDNCTFQLFCTDKLIFISDFLAIKRKTWNINNTNKRSRAE